jgi:hypothetical protein
LLRSHAGAQDRIAAPDEPREASLEGRTLHQDVSAAGLAAEADVGTQAVHQPRLAAAGVRLPQADDVAEEELEHGVA